MKTGIHPEYKTAQVTCNCGNTFETRSTKGGGEADFARSRRSRLVERHIAPFGFRIRCPLQMKFDHGLRGFGRSPVDSGDSRPAVPLPLFG